MVYPIVYSFSCVTALFMFVADFVFSVIPIYVGV